MASCSCSEQLFDLHQTKFADPFKQLNKAFTKCSTDATPAMLEIVSNWNIPTQPGLKLCPTCRKKLIAKQKQELSESSIGEELKQVQDVDMEVIEQEVSFSQLNEND